MNIDKNSTGMALAYNELKSSLMRFAYRYFKKPHDIEDVVHEAFVKVIEAQKSRQIQHTQTYLFQTVKNLSLKKLDKSENKYTDSVGDLLDDSVLQESLTLEHQVESDHKLALFCRVIRQLPVKCQRVYILRRVYGFSVQEISEKMGISKKTVEAHLTKAIVRCTDLMEQEEVSPSSQLKERLSK